MKPLMKATLMPQVKVSVVMCTYNGEKFLQEQIDSILNQTYPIHELIIQDDRSTDHTVDIVRKYQHQDSRVKLFINEQPLGFNHNFSIAFTRAEGDYIASTDQDDIWRADKIEVLLKHMAGHSLLFHNSVLFTDDPQHTSGMKNASNVIYNPLYLLIKPYVPGHECFFDRSIMSHFMEAVKKEPHISYDSLLMLAAVTSGPISFINEGLVYWRRHPKATSYHTSSQYGLLKGLLSAFKSLKEPTKRNVTQRYFKALNTYPFTGASARIVRYMGKGNLWGIIQSCMICCHNHKQLYPYNNILQSYIKSFFTPLYFIRDCSKFIIC